MDFVTSPTNFSPAPDRESRSEKKEQAAHDTSHDISVQTSSHPARHRPLVVKHVYYFPNALNKRQDFDIRYVDRHLHTTAPCDINSVVIPLRVK